MVVRKGLMQGTGKTGYFNILPRDPLIHSQSARGISQPQTIRYLNLNRYQGRWHEISSFPAWFQSGCKKAIADYRLAKDGMKVTNSCIRDGQRDYRYALAVPTDSSNARLKVDFGSIFAPKGDYWVIDTDYKTAIVGTPDRKYLWILARSPSIDKAEYGRLVKKAKEQGFDTDRLQKGGKLDYSGTYNRVIVNHEQGMEELKSLPLKNVHYDGKMVKFNLGDKHISYKLKFNPSVKNIANWGHSLTDNRVFIDKDVPDKYKPQLAVHEAIEQYVSERYGFRYHEAHDIAEHFEKKYTDQKGIDWQASQNAIFNTKT